MTPILGIIASSTTAARLGDYESIATVTVTSATQGTVEFTSIPSTYAHLQLRWLVRTDRATSTGDYMIVRFNNISSAGSYYSQHLLTGNGTSASAGADGAQTSLYVERTASGSQTANIFGAGITDILDYGNTNKNKVIRTLSGLEDNSGTTNSLARFSSGMLLSTPAISSIQILPGIGTGFVTNSHFALYGIKG